MTDEEKAEEYANDKVHHSEILGERNRLKQAFIDGANFGYDKGKKELEQWKQEWQDAQIKANEEGFTRTILQIKYSELEKENARLSKMLNEAIDFIEQEDMQCKLCSFYLSCRDGDCAYKDEIPISDIIRAELEKRVENKK